jgi:hypothetical protein
MGGQCIASTIRTALRAKPRGCSCAKSLSPAGEGAEWMIVGDAGVAQEGSLDALGRMLAPWERPED